MSNDILESRALIVSIIGSLIMAALGFYFAIVVGSDAILLDGIFSGVGFIAAFLTLKVASLVRLPDDEHFHYGYSHFVPLLNVLKALLLLVLCTVALVSALGALLAGGRSMAMGSAVVYGAVAAIGCLTIALYINRVKKITGSALVAVDAQSWAIDTVMSAAVLLVFVVGWAIQDTTFSVYLIYVDPAMVAILCLLSLPIPVKILIDNGREVLLVAPDEKLQEAVNACFLETTHDLPVEDYRIRLLKMGNTLNILVHLKPGTGFALTGINQLDSIQKRFQQSLETLDVKTATDIVFIEDMSLSQ